MLRIYYRITNSDNSKRRPRYFSKYLSLKNFLFGLKRVAKYKFTLINDGEIQTEAEQLAAEVGDIIRIASVGNSESFWHAFNLAIKHKPFDLIYFVEDDYLHTPDAIEKLLESSEELTGIDYITLYDHPIRYASDYKLGLDMPLRKSAVYISSRHHWRTVESTCMTFAARAKTLREDSRVFERYVRGSAVPEDRELFRRLQGVQGYEVGSAFRTLIGPIPSLATHCQEPWIAPVVNWERIAEETTSW